MAISAVTLAEAHYGIQVMPLSRRRLKLETYYASISSLLPILPFDESAALWLAQERARLQKIGRPVPFEDALIAGVAASRDLILITHNVADFQGFNGLTIEDWMIPS